MAKRYYITQYQAWWSLSKNEFLSLLSEVKKTGGYDLSNYKQLRARPNCTYMYDGHPYSKNKAVEVVECLDWRWSDFNCYYKNECKLLK